MVPAEEPEPFEVAGWSPGLACPYCATPLEHAPARRRKCPGCHQVIVGHQIAGQVFLVREADEQAFQMAVRAAWDTHLEAARARDGQAGLLVGEWSPDVHGESHYQPALAACVGPLDDRQGAQFRCVAQLIREPANPFDRNAVVVAVSGVKVGYVAQDDAPHLQPLLRRLEMEGKPALVRATIRGGYLREGFRTSLGIFLDGVPMQ
jgi:hypothetical protein